MLEGHMCGHFTPPTPSEDVSVSDTCHTVMRGIYGTDIAGSRTIATPSLEVARVGNEAGWVGTVEESARLVPTGPDPLHHNNNPISP
ncbi:unnamed protein product [Lupinus luteus]|uniref:Uncharacterized protein n=1 Tax=Lupinus luteus TaxID=3873 RepID=A0AAV1YJC1_LUPLU